LAIEQTIEATTFCFLNKSVLPIGHMAKVELGFREIVGQSVLGLL